ncbi:hypothetical protein LOZ53_001513 [Ophidiomyces ophidiicola]|nr:hypothetical protein LOZ55_003427 [Ophidiomyces ophidiicola]KAI1991200.1 hypothetical protein LOZ51_004733 [Ophidiomyces ophidiicola]KAI1994126.1 hypothetical protein LOZ54_001145 [Ophidiomyces ophidiicola]KAI1995113.1 hypothetical protein LOZ53_001513 [Ophidiomyces ophidiicola]
MSVRGTHAKALLEVLLGLEWNPELHSDCSGLFVGWWVCIGIKPQSVTATFDYTTTIPPVVVPPKTGEYTPTTFPAVNSSFTASPTLDGQAKDCEAFYQAQSGDTCRVITNRGFPSEKQFFEWNPALKGNCDGLWAGYWYCVAVKGARPMPPRVTSLPSPVPTGQPSNCNSWYQTTSTETCDDIVSIFVAFSKEDFIKWNPSVGPKCDGIQKGLYYCVGVPGTPTTRTGPVPTATAPTETPTQSGIAPTCNNFWLVSSSDTCESISNRNGISVKQFYIWNPAVGTSTCDHLVTNTYVCVGVGNGSTSMSVTSGPTTTAKTTSTTGISSVTSSDKPSTTSGGAVATPAPVQAGMVTGCRRFYKAQSGDNCWAIANSAKIDLNDFYKWNPSVGTDCKNLWLDYWYCIGIAGPVTTISTGAPVPT